MAACVLEKKICWLLSDKHFPERAPEYQVTFLFHPSLALLPVKTPHLFQKPTCTKQHQELGWGGHSLSDVMFKVDA
jgi:hypothetical protein